MAAFVYLNEREEVIATRHLHSQSADLLHLPIRRIVRDTILFGAASVVMAHNHPSGMAHPSRADIRATRRLAGALELFDTRLSDHWIVTDDQTISLRAMGLM